MQAALITAYKDYEILKRLVLTLKKEGIASYIHIDKRSYITREQISELQFISHVIDIRREIYWGSYTHLLAILDLIKISLNNKDVDYVHIISGQDFPIGSVLSSVDPNAIYLNVESIDEMDSLVLDRIAYRKIFSIFESFRLIYRAINRISLETQKLLCRKRRKSKTFGNIYKGLIWSSFPRYIADYLVNDDKSKDFLKELRSYYIPEEYFIQTILMNSPYRDCIVGNNRRFMLWQQRHGTIPAILEMGDWADIVGGGDLFARKIDSRLSKSLLDHLAKKRE